MHFAVNLTPAGVWGKKKAIVIKLYWVIKNSHFKPGKLNLFSGIEIVLTFGRSCMNQDSLKKHVH